MHRYELTYRKLHNFIRAKGCFICMDDHATARGPLLTVKNYYPAIFANRTNLRSENE